MEKELNETESAIIESAKISQNNLLDIFEKIAIDNLDEGFRSLRLTTLLKQIKLYRGEIKRLNAPIRLQKSYEFQNGLK